MGIKSYDTFVVGKVFARQIAANPERQAKIVNMTGGKLFYKNEADVDTGDTELANGASVTTEETLWIISETQTKVLVEHLDGLTVQDFTVNDKTAVIGELEVDGVINHDGAKVGFCGAAPVAPPEVAKEEGEEKKATVAELQEALEALGLIEEEA
jgi:hypothetical protein